MAVHYRTKGIFLKKTDRGEADQFLTVYTEEFGKMSILGKAIRKAASKLRGGAELFYLSEIEFIQGKNHKTLTDAILIDKFRGIREDLDKLRIAHQIAAVLDKLAVKEEKDEEIWQLLNEVLGKVNDLRFKIYDLRLMYYYFFWSLISLLGYRPQISGCSLQGEKVSCDIIKILKVIFKKDWQILSRLKLEAEHISLLKNTSEWYIIKIHEK
ncbi:MAG: DNA repair protein RecO [Candidatus Nealsonbacteria bacterium]|nr:DNA repair protein RecO [Candidatus Nealsonbacteria bacterium]